MKRQYKAKVYKVIMIFLSSAWVVFFFFPMMQRNIVMYQRIREGNKRLKEWSDHGFTQSGDLQKELKKLKESYVERKEQLPSMMNQEDILKLIGGIESRSQITFLSLSFQEGESFSIEHNARVCLQQVDISFAGTPKQLQSFIDEIYAMDEPTKVDQFYINCEEKTKIQGNFSWTFYGVEGERGQENVQWES